MAARFSAGEGTAITGQPAWARQYRLTRPCRRRPNVPRRPAPTTSLSPSRLAAPTRTGPGFPRMTSGSAMERGLMFVIAISDGSSLAVLAGSECDTDLVAYEMSLLIEAVGDVLTPAARAQGLSRVS